MQSLEHILHAGEHLTVRAGVVDKHIKTHITNLDKKHFGHVYNREKEETT